MVSFINNKLSFQSFKKLVKTNLTVPRQEIGMTEDDVVDINTGMNLKPFFLVLVAAILGTVFYVRPVFQRFVYRITFASPLTVLFFIPAIALFLLGRSKEIGWMKPLALTVFIIGTVFSMVAYFPTQFALLETVQAGNLTDLPETGNSRIVPREVAYQYAYNTLQEPRYTLSDIDDITVLNGSAYWSFGLVPDTFIERYFGNQKGAVYFDMSNTSTTPIRTDGEMRYGMGMQIRDNVFWKVAKKKFFAGYQDPFMVYHEGENYIAYPYVRHRWSFKYVVPVAVPEFRGVVLVDEEGNMEDLPKSEALENEVLKDQNFYPYDLARRRVDSINMENGVFNYLFRKKEVFEIDSPGGYNRQPYSVLTEEGMKYFVTVEPYGNAGGVYRIFVIDGRTGNISQYRTEKTLYGAERARDLVKSHNELSRISWNSFKTSEPIPVVKDGDLYWQIKIIARDNSDVSRVVYVNSKTKNVAPFNAKKSEKFFEIDSVENVSMGTVPGKDLNSTQDNSGPGKRIIVMNEGRIVANYSLENHDVEIR